MAGRSPADGTGRRVDAPWTSPEMTAPADAQLRLTARARRGSNIEWCSSIGGHGGATAETDRGSRCNAATPPTYATSTTSRPHRPLRLLPRCPQGHRCHRAPSARSSWRQSPAAIDPQRGARCGNTNGGPAGFYRGREAARGAGETRSRSAAWTLPLSGAVLSTLATPTAASVPK